MTVKYQKYFRNWCRKNIHCLFIIRAGCEAAVHAMRQLFHDPGSQAVLLVDASNAFNSVNGQAALHNILRICPSLNCSDPD